MEAHLLAGVKTIPTHPLSLFLERESQGVLNKEHGVVASVRDWAYSDIRSSPRNRSSPLIGTSPRGSHSLPHRKSDHTTVQGNSTLVFGPREVTCYQPNPSTTPSAPLKKTCVRSPLHNVPHPIGIQPRKSLSPQAFSSFLKIGTHLPFPHSEFSLDFEIQFDKCLPLTTYKHDFRAFHCRSFPPPEEDPLLPLIPQEEVPSSCHLIAGPLSLSLSGG